MNHIKNYVLEKELGSGTFGVTYLAKDLTNNRYVAIKAIDIAKSKQYGADLMSIHEEIDTLKQLSGSSCSPYIACYYESFESVWYNSPTIFIVSEYIDGKSFYKIIKDYEFAPGSLYPLFCQLLWGLKYIHDNGYAHRDIKPDNVMINRKGQVKYIDFGIACVDKCKQVNCTNLCRGNVGTPYYMPPEFFNGTKVDSLEEAKKHDIWSLAVMMFEMANGPNVYPFNIYEDIWHPLPVEKLGAEIAKAPGYRSNYQRDNGQANRFIMSLLINNWRSRPSIEQAINNYRQIIGPCGKKL